MSFHHGGGVGIGYSLHAGMVIVADGTPTPEQRLDACSTTDPGMGVVRHADAGYDEAKDVARQQRREDPRCSEPSAWIITSGVASPPSDSSWTLDPRRFQRLGRLVRASPPTPATSPAINGR